MRDVAVEAEVSTQTVSNVVNGRLHLMGAQTRERVEQTMRRLEYYPNTSARGLRSTRTRTLGVLVLDETHSALADPLTSMIIAGAGDVARGVDYGLLVQVARPGGPREGLLRPVLEQRVDGAILILSGKPSMRRWYVDWLWDAKAAFAVLDEIVEHPGILSVRAADRDAGRQVAEHLIAQGHARIAFIGHRVPWPVLEQRHLGYSDALRAAGLQPDPDLQVFDAGWRAAGGGEMAARLLALADPPTAIMCGSDVLALGALRTATTRGLRVPGDVAISGFDDFEFAAFVEPPLTTVRIPGYDMGRLAAEMLLADLAGEPARVRQLVLPVELCLRESA
jgi:DNA-binding LacI/PurR family transcriptional regulator